MTARPFITKTRALLKDTTESGSYPAFRTRVRILTDGASIVETEPFVGVIGLPL
jgi:hypothetical protein